VVKSAPIDKGEENLIATLTTQNSKFKNQYGIIIEKNKLLVDQLEKKKREMAALKRSTSTKKSNSEVLASKENLMQDVEIRAGPTHFQTQTQTKNLDNTIANVNPSATDSNLLEVARKYKARLTAAEEQLSQLRDDNARLRQESNNLPARGKTDTDGHQLRDTNWRLQQLQTQYDFLVSKTSSQGNAFKQNEEKLEDYAQKVRDLRRALEELRYEKESTDAKAVRADELEDLVSELRASNRSLEDKIARLCDSPFIGDAFGQKDARIRFEDAAKEREDYNSKMSHLQEAVRTHFSALTSLKQQAAQYREEKEHAEKTAEELRNKYQELNANTSLMQDKLRLYSGEFHRIFNIMM
jgi:DNA repair exonuclease SbcCD ATPase subunit